MNGSYPDLTELLRHPAYVETIPVEAIPPLLAQLAAVQNALAARLIGDSAGSTRHRTMPEADTLLTAEQAAQLLSVTPGWMYRHAEQLPFTRRLSRKVLRFHAGEQLQGEFSQINRSG